MQLWKLTLAYDGSDFFGWQVQPNLPTIQGRLAAALEHITGESVLPQGSGRTDTGVHALAQVASFTLLAPIPAANLQRALNRALPPSIRVLSAAHAEPGFHARHSALRKTYEYRVFRRCGSHENEAGSAVPRRSEAVCPPFLAPFVWDCPWPVALVRATEAAQHICGEHDFTSFAAVDPDLSARMNSQAAPSAVRTIYASKWTEEDGLLIYRVTGSGFLHHMVRNLVGTFVDAACGRSDPKAIPHILRSRDRSAAGPTAPARGLFLHHVEYPQ